MRAGYMHTFRSLPQQIGLIPGPMAVALGDIDTARGREQAFRGQHPQSLKTLTEIARIQSTEASNAIEQITAPAKRIRALVAEKTTPENRSEAEIAGYRAVLDTIHSSADAIPSSPPWSSNCTATSTSSPACRQVDGRALTTRSPSGKQTGPRRSGFGRFRRSRPRLRWRELHQSFAAARDGHQHHPLLLVGAYVFDFLAIHPFRDGNGRMSRLLTLLALYQAGYEVGRFISLERIDQREQGDLLRRASGLRPRVARGQARHQAVAELLPRRAGGRLQRVRGTGRGRRGTRCQARVHRAVHPLIMSNEFTVSEVRQASGGTSDSYINKVFAELRDAGVIERIGSGRGTRWRRLRANF